MPWSLNGIAEEIVTRRREVPMRRSVLVALTGIDGSGKGYVAGDLAACRPRPRRWTTRGRQQQGILATTHAWAKTARARCRARGKVAANAGHDDVAPGGAIPP